MDNHITIDAIKRVEKHVYGKEEPSNAEDLTVEFENQSGDRFLLYFHDSNNWAIERIGWDINYPILYFKLLGDAEEAMSIIKRSV